MLLKCASAASAWPSSVTSRKGKHPLALVRERLGETPDIKISGNNDVSSGQRCSDGRGRCRQPR